jgi:rare lipoprotein A
MHKLILYLSLFLFCSSALAQQSHVYHGKATFYSKKFNGRKTYTGERFSSTKYTAAHRSFPLQSLIKVTNPRNNKSVIVRINDRFHKKNYIDLSLIAAKQIDIVSHGTVKVNMQLLDDSFMQEYKNQTSDYVTIEPAPDSVINEITPVASEEFYIRVASFKLKKTAELMLVKNLPKKFKHIANIQKARYKGKPLYKVMIGPFLTKKEAIAVKAKIKPKFKDAKIITKNR